MRFSLVLSVALLLRGQNNALKTKPEDYPVHFQMDAVTLTAEFLVHSLPTPQGTLVAGDYLVVEVAFFGPRMSRLKMSPDHFTLRVNGRGTPLSTQIPGMVAASIKFPNAAAHLETSGSVGVGDGTVGVGPRAPQSRFPGDGNDRTTGQPVTIKQKEQEDSIDTRVQNVSLPEGEQTLPRSGLIYFPFRGKMKNIHSLELLYDGPMGKAKLKLL